MVVQVGRAVGPGFLEVLRADEEVSQAVLRVVGRVPSWACAVRFLELPNAQTQRTGPPRRSSILSKIDAIGRCHPHNV